MRTEGGIQMPNEPVKITAQELEGIKKLPSCQFMLGGTPQTGFFDKVNEKIYYLDSEGNWMVKRARVKKREPEKPQEEEAPAEENGEEEESGKRRWLRRKAKSDVEDESEDGRSRLDALKESLEQPLFEKIPLTRKKLLVIIGGMMVLFIIGSIASSVLFGGNDTPSNPTPIENQEPVDEPDPSLNTIQVIQVKQDLIPGDVITEDVIQSATISAESYNQITLGGTNIYQYTEDSLADMDAKGTFCKSVLSTKVNRKLEKNGYLMLDTKKEYEKYLSEYLDIVQVEPEQVPLVDDWYAAGYKAIVFSTDAYGTEVNLVAAEQYIGDESVKIVIEPAEINPAFQFSQDISNCKQTSVIVYIQAEVLDNAESIEFLVKGES